MPILYYHRAEAVPVGFSSWSHARQRKFLAYDVLPGALEAQLEWLQSHRYTTILPSRLADYWDHGRPLPRRPVILTFDDGFRSWSTTVLPMLHRHHMVAEFYLTLDAIEARSITWPEVRALAREGNGIGAHDVHHVQLTMLGHGRKPASPAVMWAEVDGARRAIAAHVGIPPDSMAYVGGGFDATLIRIVAKAGYRSARSIVRGIVQSRSRRYAMTVVRVGALDDVVDVVTQTLAAGLPTFTARMRGVSDLRRD